MDAYANCESTLCEISRDGSRNEPMTESLMSVYDFDAIKRVYNNSIYKSEEDCTSCDGLMWHDALKVLVEFKNGKNFSANDIHLKALHSLLILCDIKDTHISNLRNELDFILVYNADNKPIDPSEIKQYEKKRKDTVQESASRDLICRLVCEKSGHEFVRFDLGKYRGLFFRDVHTYNQEEFQKWLERSVVAS